MNLVMYSHSVTPPDIWLLSISLNKYMLLFHHHWNWKTLKQAIACSRGQLRCLCVQSIMSQNQKKFFLENSILSYWIRNYLKYITYLYTVKLRYTWRLDLTLQTVLCIMWNIMPSKLYTFLCKSEQWIRNDKIVVEYA